MYAKHSSEVNLKLCYHIAISKAVQKGFCTWERLSKESVIVAFALLLCKTKQSKRSLIKYRTERRSSRCLKLEGNEIPK